MPIETPTKGRGGCSRMTVSPTCQARPGVCQRPGLEGGLRAAPEEVRAVRAPQEHAGLAGPAGARALFKAFA